MVVVGEDILPVIFSQLSVLASFASRDPILVEVRIKCSVFHLASMISFIIPADLAYVRLWGIEVLDLHVNRVSYCTATVATSCQKGSGVSFQRGLGVVSCRLAIGTKRRRPQLWFSG